MSRQKPCGPACSCPPNSPFRWAERSAPSFAQVLQKGHVQSEAMKTYVESQRTAGKDVGHIHGLSDRTQHLRRPPVAFTTKGRRK